MKVDPKLVEEAIEGDSYALNRLLQHSYPAAYGYALKYFGEHDTAIEVTQKCLIKVSGHLHELDFVAQYRPWFFRLLINQCHEEKRRAKGKSLLHWLSFSGQKTQSLEQAALHNHLADPEGEADHELSTKERQMVIQQALKSLPNESRNVLLLKHYENLKFREIADILGISENTVKTRLYSALKKLNNYFERNPHLKSEVWHE